MIFEDDISIHKEHEKPGTHILDIDKYKAALKNAVIFKYDKNIELFSDDESNDLYYVHNKGFIAKNNKKYFINFWPQDNNDSTIDSFHFKFFKDLTNDQMLELRNIMLKFGKKHKAFQFQYDDVIIFTLFPCKHVFKHNYRSQFWALNKLSVK